MTTRDGHNGTRPAAPLAAPSPARAPLGPPRTSDVANVGESYRVATYQRVYAVRYLKPPSNDEFALLARDMDAMRTQMGELLFYLGIVSATAEVPTPAEREALSAFGERTIHNFATCNMVIEGSGFRPSLQRSVVTAAHLLRGQRVWCHKTTDTAIQRVARDAGIDAARLANALQRSLDV
jgi:hypothetical protein